MTARRPRATNLDLAAQSLGIRWRSGRDGVAHALPKQGTRYLCNRMPIPDRFAWPPVTRCGWCVAKLEEYAQARLAG